KGKVVLTDIRNAKVEDFGHRQALSRANCCAQSAKAALGHVDVELCGVDALRGTVGCLSNLFYRAYRFDFNTIDRADLGALVADNAVIDFIMQTIPAVVGHRYHLMRILYGRDPA